MLGWILAAAVGWGLAIVVEASSIDGEDALILICWGGAGYAFFRAWVHSPNVIARVLVGVCATAYVLLTLAVGCVLLLLLASGSG